MTTDNSPTRIIHPRAKLKILAAGDFHNDVSIAKRLAKRAVDEGVDLILLNGDIVEEENPHGIVGHFAATNKKVVLVPGNHDLVATDFLAEAYKAKNLHGKYLVHYNIGIAGMGGANCGVTAISDEETYDLIKKSMEKIKHLPTRILVTHVHPAGSKMEHFSNFISGSKGLRWAIDAFKPDFVICGHVHEAEGIEEMIGKTRVINVGKKGKILDLE